ncbi:hypothetical protein Tco_1378566 [Tanacetum coccineum]
MSESSPDHKVRVHLLLPNSSHHQNSSITQHFIFFFKYKLDHRPIVFNATVILMHCLQSFHLQKELHSLLQTAGMLRNLRPGLNGLPQPKNEYLITVRYAHEDVDEPQNPISLFLKADRLDSFTSSRFWYVVKGTTALEPDDLASFNEWLRSIIRKVKEEAISLMLILNIMPRFSNDYHSDAVQTGHIQNTCTRPPVLKGKESDVYRIALASAKRTAHPNVDPEVFQMRHQLGARNEGLFDKGTTEYNEVERPVAYARVLRTWSR